MRRYSNVKGEGKFFTVDLLDANGGEIRAISFNETADKFDQILQMGNVVTISKASLKPKKPGQVSLETLLPTLQDNPKRPKDFHSACQAQEFDCMYI